MSFRSARRLAAFAAIVSLSLAATTAPAAVFTDATGEQFNPGETHLDVSSVDVTNDATNIVFRIGLVGSPTAPNWGKYMIGIDSVDGAGAATNGWGRPISMSGMDYWVGSWVDTTPPGAEIWTFSNNAWAKAATTYGEGVPLAAPVTGANSVTITLPLAPLGLEPGESFDFDVYTSGGGGGDSAIDASSNPARAATDWGVAYASGNNVSTYTVVVPEPASLGVLALAAGALLTRRRR